MSLELLREEIVRTKLRIEKSERDRKAQKSLQQDLAEDKEGLKLARGLIVNYKRMLSDIEEHQTAHKSGAMEDVYRAIQASCDIIPDCGEIRPHIESGAFRIVDKTGVNIKDIEGDGVKCIASVLVRHAILARTGYQKFMVLDESLAPVNDINSATFSKYLPLLGRDMLIVMIEQKSSVFDHAGKILSYRVTKDGDVSSVIREEPNGETV
jgi:hypothetical protein